MQIPGVLCLAFALFSLLQSALPFRRVCYFTNWSRDLQQAGARFRLTDVEPYLCTHLVYAFAAVQPSNSSLQPIVTLLAEGPQEEFERYRKFNALKDVNRQLKTLLSVGGSVQANEDFVQIVGTDSGRKQFAANAVTYLRTWGFDGLDIDWEYPGSPPDTKANFTQLLTEVRQAFKADGQSRQVTPLLLSVAAPVSQAQMKAGYDIPQVSRLVDFINLMAYDFHGSWNSITSFNSPLYARSGDLRYSPELSVNWAVRTWLQQGAQAQKLVLGIAGYGQSFTLQNSSQHEVGAPTNGSGTAGRWRRMQGQLAYYEVCEYISAGGTQVWDDLQRVPYVYVGNQWVGFDDPDSIKDKVDYAMQHSLGGIMLWSLDMDDFRGAFCGKGRYPLLTAMVTSLSSYFPNASVHLTDTVTWRHPDDATAPLPTTVPSLANTTKGSSPEFSTMTQTSSTTTVTTLTTSPTLSTTFPASSTSSTRGDIRHDKTTQPVVVITKGQSSASLLFPCQLLLAFALVVHRVSL